MTLSKNSGFTFVEFIVILILLVVLSVIGLGRFLGGNTFNEIILRDEIIAMARNAQQGSRGRDSATFTITPNLPGDSVTLTSSDVGGTIDSITTSLGDVSLSGDINDTASCATTPGANAITNAAPMTLNFKSLGDLDVSGVTGSTGAITSAVRICINNDASSSVCVSPSGFAYAGDCDV